MESQSSISVKNGGGSVSPHASSNNKKSPVSRQGSAFIGKVTQRRESVYSNVSRSRVTPMGVNTDIGSVHESSNLGGGRREGGKVS